MSVKRRSYLLIGRVIGPAALVALHIYTFVTKRPRVRVIVTNEQDEILLVRGVISHLGNWTLPGGGVNRDEELAAAASRELEEETGVAHHASEFAFVRTVEKRESGLGFVAPLFSIVIKKSELPKKLVNPKEIADARWFKQDDLPDQTATIVHLAVAKKAGKRYA